MIILSIKIISTVMDVFEQGTIYACYWIDCSAIKTYVINKDKHQCNVVDATRLHFLSLNRSNVIQLKGNHVSLGQKPIYHLG